ncbi:MAG: cyclodeaminase/cyclohydrolase family protein [Actinobacteria bacterium]|nr:MAG: cyclodeaminase/cyclohydrolase family protein [Actinomycetota bacterium]
MTPDSYLDLRLDDFLARLATAGRAPGGGSAAAFTIALAAGLVAMVARSSGDSWRDAAGVGAQATALLERITPLVRADAEAWEDALAELQATTGGDLEQRNDTLERKLDDAAAVPILIADAGADAASLAELAADRGEGAYRADAAVAAVLAAAGARAASHLVRVNLGVREGDARLARARRSADAAADAAARALDAAG